MLFGFTQMVKLFAALATSDAQFNEMVGDSVTNAIWIDDEKRDLTLNVYVEGDEGIPEEPTVTVKTKLKGKTEA